MTYIRAWLSLKFGQIRPRTTELAALKLDGVPVGVPLDLSTPTGIGTYGENCKSGNVSKYRVLLVAFLLLWHKN